MWPLYNLVIDNPGSVCSGFVLGAVKCHEFISEKKHSKVKTMRTDYNSPKYCHSSRFLTPLNYASRHWSLSSWAVCCLVCICLMWSHSLRKCVPDTREWFAMKLFSQWLWNWKLNTKKNVKALQSKLWLYIKQYLINLTLINNIKKCNFEAQTDQGTYVLGDG